MFSLNSYLLMPPVWLSLCTLLLQKHCDRQCKYYLLFVYHWKTKGNPNVTEINKKKKSISYYIMKMNLKSATTCTQNCSLNCC